MARQRVAAQVSIFAVVLLSFVGVSFAQGAHCVCDCVYARSERIKNHKYFESAEQSCSLIEGKACIGTHRGQTFRGTINNCESGPREFSSDFSALLNPTSLNDSVEEQVRAGIVRAASRAGTR